MTMTLVSRYVRAGTDRARRSVKSRFLRFAPIITCERCGRPLFSTFPVIAGGRLHLFGAEGITVEVQWSSKRTLRFRHEALDRCRRDEPLLPIGQLGAVSLSSRSDP
jgi:hypothetical protein